MEGFWKNNILENGIKRAGDFLANEDNWRIHPLDQQKALEGSLDELGWLKRVIVNKRTSDEWGNMQGVETLLDGHLRVMSALSKSEEEPVPFEYVDLGPDEEAKALSLLDPMGTRATTDREKLNEIIGRVKSCQPALQKFYSELAERERIIPKADNGTQENEGDENPPVIEAEDLPLIIGDYKFPSDNDYGIPMLKLGMQATALELPFTKWGSIARKSRMEGTYHFYTDDYKFNNLWKDPSIVPISGCRSAIEPNWTTGDNFPKALILWCTFRKRWMARYWQENGIRIFVDLNVDDINAEDNLVGVPQGWKSYCTRGYNKYTDSIIWQYELAKERAGEEPLLVVYGGGENIADACKKRGWVHIVEDATKKRAKVA